MSSTTIKQESKDSHKQEHLRRRLNDVTMLGDDTGSSSQVPLLPLYEMAEME